MCRVCHMYVVESTVVFVVTVNSAINGVKDTIGFRLQFNLSLASSLNDSSPGSDADVETNAILVELL